MADEETVMTIDKIRERLRFYNVGAVADAVGLSRQGLYQVLKPENDPRFSTVKKLSDFLRQN